MDLVCLNSVQARLITITLDVWPIIRGASQSSIIIHKSIKNSSGNAIYGCMLLHYYNVCMAMLIVVGMCYTIVFVTFNICWQCWLYTSSHVISLHQLCIICLAVTMNQRWEYIAICC